MKNRVDAFDRALHFPLRPSWLLFLLAFGLLVLLATLPVVSSVPILTVSLIAAGDLGPEKTFPSLGSLLILYLFTAVMRGAQEAPENALGFQTS